MHVRNVFYATIDQELKAKSLVGVLVSNRSLKQSKHVEDNYCFERVQNYVVIWFINSKRYRNRVLDLWNEMREVEQTWTDDDASTQTMTLMTQEIPPSENMNMTELRSHSKHVCWTWCWCERWSSKLCSRCQQPAKGFSDTCLEQRLAACEVISWDVPYKKIHTFVCLSLISLMLDITGHARSIKIFFSLKFYYRLP